MMFICHITFLFVLYFEIELLYAIPKNASSRIWLRFFYELLVMQRVWAEPDKNPTSTIFYRRKPEPNPSANL